MRVKYPRTMHLPWSLGVTSDDKVLKDTRLFVGKRVVVTEKLDGENTTIFHDGTHARSLDSKDHPSRHWLKAFHASISYLMPHELRICGENVFAKHSLFYDQLESYFYMFSVWNQNNECLSWDETEMWSEELGIPLPPVLYRGVWDEKVIKALYTGKSTLGEEAEGYVVRLEDSFHYDDFETSVAKFVREDHVQTSEHWMSQEVIPNKLKG